MKTRKTRKTRKTQRVLGAEKKVELNKRAEKCLLLGKELGLHPDTILLLTISDYPLKKVKHILLDTKNAFSRTLLFEIDKTDKKNLQGLRGRSKKKKTYFLEQTFAQKNEKLIELDKSYKCLKYKNLILDHIIALTLKTGNYWIDKPAFIDYAF